MAHLTRRAAILGGIGSALGTTEATRRKQKKRRHDHRQRADKPTPTPTPTPAPTPAPAPADHDAILSDLARRMIFGVRDEGTPLDELEAMLARGEVVEALCGTQAHLAVRELHQRGATSRRVGALAEPYGGPDQSHVMLEVRVGAAWQCYDVMSNTRALDASGDGISVVAWCAVGERHWERIASDANWPRTDDEIAGIYERTLGTPWIEDARGYAVFHHPADAERIVAALPWLVPVDRQIWQALLA